MGICFRKNTAQNLDCIENPRLAGITNLVGIYWEVTPSMIDVVSITTWELIKTLCKGTSVAEFNDIVFKASGKTFYPIQADFNENIYNKDENFDEVKFW